MFKNVKSKVALSLSVGMVVLASSASNVSASLGDNAEQFANTAQTEALGLAEVVGLIGIVACGILFGVGQREIAKKCIIGVLVGYFVIKYAQPIWSIFTGGI